MTIRVALNKRIINDCLALHYKHQPAGKRLRQRLLWIPAILLVLAVGIIIDELNQPRVGVNFAMALSYIGFAIGYYFFMRHRMLKAGRRMLRNLGPNASFTIEVEENQLVSKTHHETFNHPWSNFKAALISPQYVLLYQANNTFTMLTGSFFEPGQFQAFKNLVRQHVSPLTDIDN